MKTKKGFTLVELLVVISIIALLLSVLMPALGKVRKQAQSIVCLSNVKQYGLLSTLYANDNNNQFSVGKGGNGPNQMDTCWLEDFAKYSKEAKLRVCPSASRGTTDATIYMGSKTKAWKWAWGDWPNINVKNNDPISYTQNNWAANPKSGVTSLGGNTMFPTANCWRRMDGPRGSTIPFLGDGCWLVALPMKEYAYSVPMQNEDVWANWGFDLFVMDRHGGGTVNYTFFDGSARHVGIKELWTLKWHRNFNTADIYTKAGGMVPSLWPVWMRKFKDY